MCATNKIAEEDGFTLLNSMVFLFFMGLMAITLVTLVVADLRMQKINMDEPRAFYSAQSGIEYALRGIFETAASYSSLGVYNNYSETLNTGNGTSCTIRIRTIGTDSLEIESTGISNDYARTIVKAINYTDVSKYAIYASGNVRYSYTVPSGRIKKYASHMPKFDVDELRNMAKPTQYYPNNLNINGFTFSRSLTFVEKNLQFKKFSWLNAGNWVVGKRTDIKFSFSPIGITVGNIYMPFQGAYFYSRVQPLFRVLVGGLIVNGDVKGTSNTWWIYRFGVIHNRSRMNALLQYSVNGGPIVINNSSWKIKK